jgi:hypothetical protein
MARTETASAAASETAVREPTAANLMYFYL